MKKTLLISLLIPIFLAVAGCSPAQNQSSGAQLQSWIDAPLDQSILPLAPYEIVTHGTDPQEVKSIEISINGDIVSTSSNLESGQLLLTASYLWHPFRPGEYLIQARSLNGNGNWSDTTSVTVRVANITPTAAPRSTSTPTSTPEVTATVCAPIAEALLNASCRSGPSTFHLPVFYLLEGEDLPIVGRNLDQTWWAVQPPTSDQPCWVSDQTVELICLPEDLAELDSPPYITRISLSTSEIYWGDNPLKQVTFQAQVGGESRVNNVRVIYRLQGKTQWLGISLLNTSGEIWQGTLHAHSIEGYNKIESSIIEYYLEAIDENGLRTQSELFNNLKLKKVP